jgi:hypothetical protein
MIACLPIDGLFAAGMAAARGLRQHDEVAARSVSCRADAPTVALRTDVRRLSFGCGN